MPYNFRNRDEIRAPARFDEPQDEQRKVSYLEPDLDEEVYRSSPPKSSRLKYRGPMISFNPDLPPAAFPTLDHPDQARLPTSRIMRPDLAWLRPQHIGTADSILNDNMRRMYAAGQLNSFDRNFLEMMSSEDEDEDEDDTPPPSLENVRWNDLSPASKLQLYDVVSEAYPSGEATLRLQLDGIEVEELTDLVLKRNECLRKEDEEGTSSWDLVPRLESHSRYQAFRRSRITHCTCLELDHTDSKMSFRVGTPARAPRKFAARGTRVATKISGTPGS